ncbi:hypothetical protein IU485_02610 [Nocardia cyriacigeorgica]|uniref:Uncharacterized protein n=1 Tax=Nocardia carnea TaxID=37328 RepID=A0ABW7TWH9_9NOCA|nr:MULTISPECIES: hypothetical protein [Nocardia]MBF6080244.1 hypothetical protein [Nocardia cyriacigeorgica]MBF6345887.1 hypothetical protein [Nocardia cyriacigeorgica]MBF6347860.1 hypothetical protein [Nocardia flavorosea]BDU06853.1 hypothetical protein FMUBM48_31160 [Nocardia cyriacigeorgica]
MAAAAAPVAASGDEGESFVDIGQCLSCGCGQLEGDLMPGPISRVGRDGCMVDFGIEFGQLLYPEAALSIEFGAQRG